MRPARDTQGHTRIGLVTITGGTKRKKKKTGERRLARRHTYRDGTIATGQITRPRRYETSALRYGAREKIYVCVWSTQHCAIPRGRRCTLCRLHSTLHMMRAGFLHSPLRLTRIPYIPLYSPPILRTDSSSGKKKKLYRQRQQQRVSLQPLPRKTLKV